MRIPKPVTRSMVAFAAASAVLLSAAPSPPVAGESSAALRVDPVPAMQPGSADPADLAQGRLLIARRELPDPNFVETVVLLIRYDEQGAMGLVVNRPTEIGLSALVPELGETGARDAIVYSGGPVERDTLMMLVRAETTPEESRAVVEDIYVSRSLPLLKRMSDDAETRDDLRIYAGYAGWEPGQLAAEVERGDWYVMPADSEIVFDRRPLGLWPRLLPRDPDQVARAF